MNLKLIKMIPKLILNKIRYGRYLDIFLTHTPPYKIHDKEDLCHRGFECFTWFIKKFKPKYMIHGHIHLYDQREERITQVEETTIVNAYAHYVLDSLIFAFTFSWFSKTDFTALCRNENNSHKRNRRFRRTLQRF